MFSMAMWLLLIVAPLQLLVGDLHGLNTLKHQPAKLAAIEGHWENIGDDSVPLTLFGWPDMEQEKNHFALEIPHMGSLLLTHSWNGQFQGLKDFPRADRPNATVVFWTFRVMVGLGLLMLALGVWAAWVRWKGQLYETGPLLRYALYMGPMGLVAMLAGWFTTEIGRQPWIVYNLMRTANGVTPNGALEVGVTLALFVVIYFIVFGAGAVYILRLIRKGPVPHEGDAPVPGGPGEFRTPSRPISATPDVDGSQPLADTRTG
jgi:cytochrome d ubiquinol oxidase subunit I